MSVSRAWKHFCFDISSLSEGQTPLKSSSSYLLWDQTSSSTSLTRSRLIWQRKACSLPWKKQLSFPDHPRDIPPEWAVDRGRRVQRKQIQACMEEGDEIRDIRRETTENWITTLGHSIFSVFAREWVCVCVYKSVFLLTLFYFLVNVLCLSLTRQKNIIYILRWHCCYSSLWLELYNSTCVQMFCT